MRLILIAAVLSISSPSIAQEAAASGATTPQDRTFTGDDGFKAEETAGGYQPATSPLSGPLVPGQPVVFRAQTLTPSQAYPPPAPRADYPPCAPKQFNNCTQLKK